MNSSPGLDDKLQQVDESISEFQSETNKQRAVKDQIEAIRLKWNAESTSRHIITSSVASTSTSTLESSPSIDQPENEPEEATKRKSASISGVNSTREARILAYEEAEKARAARVDEPSESQLELMNRMLKVIKSSPNPGALEMKIMVEKSSDNRFGFLRPKGKYSKDWEDMKSGKKKPAVVSSLVAYGSDSEEEEEEEDVLDDQLPVVKSDTAEDPEGHKQKKAKLEVDSDSVS